MMASTFSSSFSALVLKPFWFVSSTIPRPRSVPLAHPCVTVIRRCAASAITFRMFSPRRTPAPPSFCPEPAVRALRFSAAARACRRASCMGMRAPPSFRPSERKPSPVYPLRSSCSCSVRSWFQRVWKGSSWGPWTMWQSLSE